MVTIKVLVNSDTLMEKTRWLRLNAKGKYTNPRVEKDHIEKQSYLVVEFIDTDAAMLFKLSV